MGVNKQEAERQRRERIGMKNIMNCGYEAEIVEYSNSRNIKVKFLETGEIVKTTMTHFRMGKVKSHFHPYLCGVGIVGNEKTRDSNGKSLNSYRCWANMIRRCYDKKEWNRCPTYKNCEVCEEWHDYSNFKKWYNENFYQIKGQRTELDKDILIKGNKIYSPFSCCFVPREINTLFVKSNSIRGLYPIGVHYNKEINKYIAQLKDGNNNNIVLGNFNTPEEAFYEYKKAKERYIKKIADKYKNEIPKKVYDAMYKYEVEITD